MLPEHGACPHISMTSDFSVTHAPGQGSELWRFVALVHAGGYS